MGNCHHQTCYPSSDFRGPNMLVLPSGVRFALYFFLVPRKNCQLPALARYPKGYFQIFLLFLNTQFFKKILEWKVLSEFYYTKKKKIGKLFDLMACWEVDDNVPIMFLLMDGCLVNPANLIAHSANHHNFMVRSVKIFSDHSQCWRRCSFR
jgi:hypothetical protein